MVELVAALGPLYTKMAQILAAQSGVLSNEFRGQLRSTFDRNQPVAFRRVQAQLRAAYGSALESTFLCIDERPIGVGSIAQVHRATLADGSQVAIKVLRPGAGGALEQSLSAMSVLFSVLDRIPRFRVLRLKANLPDLSRAILAQVDLGLERANQEAIAEAFRGHPFVTVPRVHGALCRDGVLVMDFVDGVRGYEAGLATVPADVLARRLQDVFYSMVYLHGRFHVDPHPGNVLFAGDRIVMLDFGLVGQFDEDQKWNLSAFYYACVRKDWDRAVGYFLTTFVDGGITAEDDPRLTAALVDLLRRHFEERFRRWSTVGFLNDGRDLLQARGLVVKPGMSLLVLSLVTGEGFLEDVDPDVDIWENARRFVDRASPYVSDAVRDRFERAFRPMLPKSFALRDRAHAALVAPTHFDRFVLPSEYPLIVDRADGAWLWDADGHRYLDLSCGYGPHILGYAHPIIQSAIIETCSRRPVNALGCADEIELAEEIVAALPAAERVIFANSGSEAITIALRLARAHTGRQRICKFEGHFHGQSDQGLVSAWFRFGGQEHAPRSVRGSVGALDAAVDNVLVLPYGRPEALDLLAAHGDEIAAVILEPMPGAACEFNRPFLEALVVRCRELGILTIFDEVVSGFRVAYGGVQTELDLRPDLTCLGKIIGGGLPCGAVAGRAEIVELAKTTSDPFRDMDERAFVGGTFSGNALTCAAGLAVLRHLRASPGHYTALHENTERLRSGFLATAERHGVAMQVGAKPGILALTFAHRPTRSVRDRFTIGNFKALVALAYYMREEGVYLPELHTIMIGAAHGPDEVDFVAAAFDRALGRMVADGLFVA